MKAKRWVKTAADSRRGRKEIVASKRGVRGFATMRRTSFACLLGLGLVIVWSGTSSVTGQTVLRGPHAAVDSATDDGGGQIRVSWSLETTPPADHAYRTTTPDKVCVGWRTVANGEFGPMTHTCFTGEVSSQADLVIDTGIGGDGPTTEYELTLVPYYFGVPLYPYVDGAWRRTRVTLNR